MEPEGEDLGGRRGRRLNANCGGNGIMFDLRAAPSEDAGRYLSAPVFNRRHTESLGEIQRGWPTEHQLLHYLAWAGRGDRRDNGLLCNVGMWLHGGDAPTTDWDAPTFLVVNR